MYIISFTKGTGPGEKYKQKNVYFWKLTQDFFEMY